MSNKYTGILLGGAIGDILGSKCRGMGLTQIKKRGVTSVFPEDGGDYSGHTELTMALANYLVDTSGYPEEMRRTELHTGYKSVVSTSDRYYPSKTKEALVNFNDKSVGVNSDSGDVMARIAPLAMLKYRTDGYLEICLEKAIYFTHGRNRHVKDAGFIYIKLLKALATGRFVTHRDIYNYIKHHARINETIYPVIKLMWGLEDRENILENIYGREIFTTKATHCLVCAVYCFLTHFDKPQEAIVRAANMGGQHADIIAKMVGELVGAYHGIMWIPEKWSKIPGEPELIKLGQSLADLDKTSRKPTPTSDQTKNN